jgi:hypothetical protein
MLPLTMKGGGVAVMETEPLKLLIISLNRIIINLTLSFYHTVNILSIEHHGTLFCGVAVNIFDSIIDFFTVIVRANVHIGTPNDVI